MPYADPARNAQRMREWRAAHPEYREREAARERIRAPRKRHAGPLSAADRERLAKLPRGREPSKFARAVFVGVDGEGMTIKGQHRYVLLAASDGSELVDPHGIGTTAALDYLTALSARSGRRAVLVCYGASYDTNMILGGLERETIAQLWAGEEVRHGRYRIKYRPRRSLEVRRVGIPEWVRRKGRWVRNIEGAFTLWDVIGFYQSTFLGALEDWLDERERAALDFARIERGKARRSAFTMAELDEIRAYTRAELRALVVLMRRLRDHLAEAGLPIARWDGAGAVAGSLLRREKVKDAIAPISDELERIAQHAYFGGRIEAVRYGTSDRPVWQYDLRSAYPSAMTQLPRLAGGSWYKHEPCERSVSGFALVRVRWSLRAEHELYPFAYRDRWGEISYPPAGEAWCWWPEWEAADAALRLRRYDQGSEVTITEARCFHPADPHARPFAFVPELYELRAQWKREGRGAEKVLKLGLNSLYGKMAQQIGYRVEEGARETKRPPYHSLLWAGYVTALTRARTFSAAMERPSAAVMFATDALFSTRRLVGLDIGQGLGQWEETAHQGIVVAQSGVYWTMTKDGPAEHSRGFDRGALDPDAIRAAWKARAEKVSAPATRFVTMGAALDSGEHPLCKVADCPTSRRRHRVWAHWRTWRTTDRDLSLDPEGKRERIPGRRGRPSDELVPTRARSAQVGPHIESGCPPTCWGSAPYPLLWRGEELPAAPTEDGSPLHVLLADVDEADV